MATHDTHHQTGSSAPYTRHSHGDTTGPSKADQLCAELLAGRPFLAPVLNASAGGRAAWTVGDHTESILRGGGR
jgi:hypothetical protein